jgi:hypothetical protein
MSNALGKWDKVDRDTFDLWAGDFDELLISISRCRRMQMTTAGLRGRGPMVWSYHTPGQPSRVLPGGEMNVRQAKAAALEILEKYLRRRRVPLRRGAPRP